MLLLSADTPEMMAKRIVEYLEWKLKRAELIEKEVAGSGLREYSRGAKDVLETSISEINAAIQNAAMLAGYVKPAAEASRPQTEECNFVHLNRETAPYFVTCDSWDLFVKEGNFFREQGGLRENWGTGWTAVNATSIGDARRKASQLFNVPLSAMHDGEE